MILIISHNHNNKYLELQSLFSNKAEIRYYADVFRSELGAATSDDDNDTRSQRAINTLNQTLSRYDLLVFSGSDCLSVTDTSNKNLHLEKQFIRQCDIPTVGICFGHQLIADAFLCDFDSQDNPTSYVKRMRNNEIRRDSIPYSNTPNKLIRRWHKYFVPEFYSHDELDVLHTLHDENQNENFVTVMHHKTKPIFSLQGHPEFIDSLHPDIGKYFFRDLNAYLLPKCSGSRKPKLSEFINACLVMYESRLEMNTQFETQALQRSLAGSAVTALSQHHPNEYTSRMTYYLINSHGELLYKSSINCLPTKITTLPDSFLQDYELGERSKFITMDNVNLRPVPYKNNIYWYRNHFNKPGQRAKSIAMTNKYVFVLNEEGKVSVINRNAVELTTSNTIKNCHGWERANGIIVLKDTLFLITEDKVFAKRLKLMPDKSFSSDKANPIVDVTSELLDDSQQLDESLSIAI